MYVYLRTHHKDKYGIPINLCSEPLTHTHTTEVVILYAGLATVTCRKKVTEIVWYTCRSKLCVSLFNGLMDTRGLQLFSPVTSFVIAIELF